MGEQHFYIRKGCGRQPVIDMRNNFHVQEYGIHPPDSLRSDELLPPMTSFPNAAAVSIHASNREVIIRVSTPNCLDRDGAGFCGDIHVALQCRL